MQLHRARALRNTPINREPWITQTPAAELERLSANNRRAWGTQNRIDRLLGRLKDVYAFAEPLLKAKLLEQFQIDVDVKTTYLRLYTSAQLPWYAPNAHKASSARTVSMLDAALHNFAHNETFQSYSTFITKTDAARDLFDVSSINQKISVSQFQTLCRKLDIGAQYKTHLDTILLNPEPVAATYLRTRVEQSQQAALKAAAHMAQLKKDIGQSAYALIRQLLSGQHNLLLDGQAMCVCDLGMMDLTFTGILIIRPDPAQAQRSRKMIAYVPHDPDHPLKEYASTLEFMNELTRQLRANKTSPSSGLGYRQFFSQFVDHEQRGHFFAGLEQRLTYVKWYEKEYADSRPSWRETPVENPQLQFSAPLITTPLWTYLYQQRLNKILNDARGIAVSTAEADSKARWAWWENFKKIASDIFNAALLVLTPFVPGLGELMLAYTAYQLTNEVVEGALDLAQGHLTELAEHVVGVVTDVIQLGAFGAGAAIGNEFRLKISPFVEGMKQVPSSDGKTRLWHPDLMPYEQPQLAPPGNLRPDTKGLYRHAGKTVLPLDGRHYEVQYDRASGRYQVQHPTRPQAYKPRLRYNEHSTWVHEGETPQEWDGSMLMRRLGQTVDGFTDAELEILRTISGTPFDSLRRIYVENTHPPLLLADTLNRFRTWEETRNIGQVIRNGQPLNPTSYWFVRLVPDMPGWPADKALKVFQSTDLSGEFHKYGNAQALSHNTLDISLHDVIAGKLPERLTTFLDDADMQSLLENHYPREQRAQVLRNRLADTVETRTPDIFDYQYRINDHSGDARVQLLQRQYPQLPSRVAEVLLSKATPTEQAIIRDEQRIPLRLKAQARESAFEVRTARATEGLHEPALLVPDTERLALNALRLNTDAFADLRVEVRDQYYDGTLRCSVGSEEAANVRVLVRDERGRYNVHDKQGTPSNSDADLYEAILMALPADKRAALGYRPGQGPLFRQWLLAMTETPAERRSLFRDPSIRRHVPRETELLLRGPGQSKTALSVEEKVENLYPHFDKAEALAFSRSLQANGAPHSQIKLLDQKIRQLKQTLETWRQRYLTEWDPESPDSTVPRAYWDYQHNGGQFLADRLLECFERKSEVFGERSLSVQEGYRLDLSSEWLPKDIERWWRQLPEELKPWLEQITTVNLDGSTFSTSSNGLLKDFRHVRQLSARNCGLSSLPETIGQMQQLETLRLNDNQIQLTPTTAEQLRNMTRMETLRLDHNPLGLAPNVERMPRLKVLSLIDTGLEGWPPGLFDKPRPRGFFLDLGANSLKRIPNVPQGSDNARLIARSRVYADRLSDAVRVRYEQYRTSVGIPPRMTYSRAAENLLELWPAFVDTSLRNETAGVGAYRPEAWHELAEEPNSDGFFTIIEGLTLSADYKAGGKANDQLTDRVWRMIGAMDIDTPLREELFLMSTDPEGCEDAGAQLFNNMGVKTLASEAYSYSTNRAELERKLVTLAKSASRLGQVGEIARADIRTRGGNPDEVEVHLAYETGLAKSLDLPWQSEDMRFRPTAGVDEQTITTARNTVLEREAGDGLVNQMIEQPFWERYLRDNWPGEIESNKRMHLEKIDWLDALRTAQTQWVQAADLPSAQRAVIEKTLTDLADRLSVPHKEVLTGEVMSDATYERLLRDIGYQEKQLSRQLTREAMSRAGI
ncbi:NEL-type E3 ubiquitin ligase domain-containing protein [Pseudomonas fluorescens]|uniref:NEL-type E3 ubiquitin ligase domain-containing protein n=1 Tax=Pseudomonas fluorescens TaxID=294 RepID=UPI001FB0F14C|nr:NEL-type E3 ubiquitin ligase domain-containing protein [Pseudomonas fluorescens]